ncbi:peptide/nickel transport system substrate-binding protein [Saccharopolyspora kobensis]|uniref:Peptide/nickel transport system substrate-binding protein n=1 Tax=Saccharopolyspora kobensis TaxID=146035 RepID=A0A1H6EHH1_9PSEU|nr:ABC transporter substrate-binding protein [Saccharopolyspora kobensis]SEG97262.1 peptide/nickel transport system substrate-binding protein [Saccharopolyspora kobensis]SFC81623.1 peptide/nickel transport system substrate-binding protein [Saccharopolyspora kobensis]
MKRLWKTALAAVLALTAAGCTSIAGNSGGATDVLKMGTFQDVTSWDPANADIGFDGPYLSAVYDPLVSLDENSQPVPALATSWSFSPDSRTLTMQLRTGVTFADGQPFDAAAAVKNLEHLRAGARSGQAYLNVDSVTAVDPQTIALHLTRKDDTLLYFMGLGRSWMASPAAIDRGDLATDPVGSGPYEYRAAESTAGAQYVFAKKPQHWDAATYPFTGVQMFPITDQTASLNAMLSGQLNVAFANPAEIPQAQQNGWNVSSKVASWVGLQFVDRTGQRLAPLGDVRVRRAINHAFDGAAILKAVGQGGGTVSNQVFPVGDPAYDPALDDRYAHDIAEAKRLLAEAGHPRGFPVRMPMSPIFQAWQPAVQQTLGELGITVSWDEMSQADYQKNAATYPMFIAVIAMDSNPMASVAGRFTTEQWYNPEPSIEAFPEIAELVARTEAASGDEQIGLARELNGKLVDLAWQDVWYQANNTYFSVPGIEVTPITGMMFPTLRFIQRG